MTTLELLVSIGVIAILASLLLPAVQSSREAARRAQCVANLRQLATATEAFVSTHGHYPGVQRTGVSGNHNAIPPGPMATVTRNESIHARLLPFVEQMVVYEKLDPVNQGNELAEPPSAMQNAFALTVDVPVFKCPSDRVPRGGNSYRGCLGPTTGLHGTWRNGMPLQGTIDMEGLGGIFQSEFKPQRLQDGHSNSALFSERVVGDSNGDDYSPFRDLAGVSGPDFYRPNDALTGCAQLTAPQRRYSFVGHTWVLPHYAHTAYNHVLTPNSRIPDCMDSAGERFHKGTMTARSLHPGGVNAVFCDGATRFVSNSIDLKVWRALGSINGGEVHDGF